MASIATVALDLDVSLLRCCEHARCPLPSTSPAGLWHCMHRCHEDCAAAIKRISELTDYIFRIGGDWVVYFTPATSTYVTEHELTMWKHIESLVINEESDELYNDYVLEYSAGTQTGSDATSITAYGTLTEYINDWQIKNSATATERIDSELSRNKDPKLNIRVVVNDNYDLESLKVGDLISIRNMNYDITSKVIKKIQYNTTSAVVDIDWYNSIARSLEQII